MAVMLYARRFTVALTALVHATEERLRLAPLLSDASARLGEIATVVAGSPSPGLRPPSPRERGEGTQRLFDILELMERAAARLVRPG